MNKEITIAISKIAIIAAAVLLATASVSRSENKSDDLKQRILSQAQSLGDGDYAFTRTVKSEQTSNGKTEQHITVDRFDPTKSNDARWTLVSMDGAPPSADALAKYNKESGKRRVPGYHRLAKYLGSNSTVTTDSRGRTVFHFNSLPKETAVIMDSDVSSNTSADVTVSDANGTPFAEHVHLSVKPMRIKLLMKLDHYESTSRYKMGPEGKPLLVENTAEMSGSGLGQAGQGRTVITYSDYRPVK
jgi:hypothetical protein